MQVDFTLYSLVVCALMLSLMINLIALFLYVDKKHPGFLFKEDWHDKKQKLILVKWYYGSAINENIAKELANNLDETELTFMYNFMKAQGRLALLED